MTERDAWEEAIILTLLGLACAVITIIPLAIIAVIFAPK